jgi:predicted transglutaminase-like cysteine proteinase
MYRCVGSARRWALLLPLSFLAACMGTISPPAMLDGNLTAPPAGWLDFCKRNSDDPYCRPLPLTSQRREQLRTVHHAVASLGARDDARLFQRTDYWTHAGAQGGDCEDLALAARARLMQMGWPPRSLRLAMAWTEKGVYHAVLTVDVEHKGRLATFVLDSRFDEVRGWDELTARGYRWDRRQAAGLPYWVTVATPSAPTVLASRS